MLESCADMKMLWLTDIHLEFLDAHQQHRFLDELRAYEADGILISGDIAQAPTISEDLARLEAALETPIYFVLGNHDFYRGSISEVRTTIRKQARGSKYLRWLSGGSGVPLSTKTCLVGHDGWGDARLGDYDGSQVQLNDFELISELTGLSRSELRARLRSLGDEAAAHLRSVLPRALASAEHVIVLTHVPPFQEASWHNGSHSAPDWLPFFACKAVGDVLVDTMRKHKEKRMTVLCGHTHGGGRARILPNLVVLTGAATYGQPVVQEVLEWD